MNCLREGHVNCNKSLNVAVGGDDETTVQMLKAWIVWGQTAADKSEHRELWARVVRAAKGDSLPTLEELNTSLNNADAARSVRDVQLKAKAAPKQHAHRGGAPKAKGKAKAKARA